MATIAKSQPDTERLLGAEAESLLTHKCTTIPSDRLHLPGPDFIDRVWSQSDRSNRVIGNLHRLYNAGRMAGTGYVSILPVDQGVEHSAGYSFSRNPAYFDPENICELAIEGGCNAVSTTSGVHGIVARKYAHKLPFVVKINHNEMLTYPNKYEHHLYGTVQQAWDMGAAAIGATIFFGSADSTRQITEIANAFAAAHEFGMATILWCYMRNSAFDKDKDYHVAADLTGQANYMGATIHADIVKQKLPELNGGYPAMNQNGEKYGKYDKLMYSELSSDHPIDLCRYQVANGYMGRVGLINSGGASGENDLEQAVRTAVINKRAGGMGLISGRKAFQRPLKDGVQLLHAIQDVYLDENITIA